MGIGGLRDPSDSRASFADIFYNNCFKNGVLPIKLPESLIQQLFEHVMKRPKYELTIDLEACVVADDDNWSTTFEIDDFRRAALLDGLDDIALTLQHEGKITEYELNHSPG